MEALIDRNQLRRAYRPDEEALVAERLIQAELSKQQASEAAAVARSLPKGARAHQTAGVEPLLAGCRLGGAEGTGRECAVAARPVTRSASE